MSRVATAKERAGRWITVRVVPQVDGGRREVQVPERYAPEVREVLRHDPARIDGLWCPTRVVEVAS